MIISSCFRALALTIITGHYTISARADMSLSNDESFIVEQGRPTVVYSPTAGISSPRSDDLEEVPLKGKASRSPSIGGGSKHVIWRDSHPSPKHPRSPPDPSSNPSSPPSLSCTGDLPKYINGVPQDGTEWVQPFDSIWEKSKFANNTCSQLEEVFAPAGHPKFCQFLSQGIFSGPSALEACCFCGGGINPGQVFEPRCEDMEWNEAKDGGVEFNCEVIDNVKDVEAYCATYGDETLACDGLTLKDACCACGGGHRNFGHEFEKAATKRRLQARRRLQDSDSRTNAGAAAASLLPNGELVVDFTSRSGAGDSPGITNLEYLGLGYDLIRGNPRGSESSELDPGFRYRVIRLRQSQANVTIDGQYLVPLGVETKYTSSCQYDDSSIEISSESDRRQSLSREARTESSSSSKESFGADNLFYRFSKSVSEDSSFSQSESFKSDSKSSQKTSSVSFESRAICSEIEASFIPGYVQELSPEFEVALDNLPVPYNTDNIRTKSAWANFFDTFGTNYVKFLVLGGKRIQSSSMSQSDYSSLVSKSVDVESTLSYEMSSAISASAGVKVGVAKAAGSAASALGGPKGQAIGGIVNVLTEGKDNDEVLFGASYNANDKTSLSQFASSKQQAEDAFKIAKKKLTNRELSFGGLPAADWREWAGTVKARPMPIQYRFESIMDFMSFEQKTAFVAAAKDIYGFDLTIEPPFLKGTVHHGIHEGTGRPVSRQSLNPNEDSKVIMQTDVIKAGGNRDPKFDSKTSFSGRCTNFQKNFFPSAVRDFTIGESSDLNDCFDKCKKLEIDNTTVVTVGGTYPAVVTGIGWTPGGPFCDCQLDSDQGPVTGGYIGKIYRGTTCYPNLNFGLSTVFTYSDVYKGKISKPTAIFATPIRGTIAPDAKEEDSFPFDGTGEVWDDNIFYALSDNINTNAKLAVQNFGPLEDAVLTNGQLSTFSFVTVDSLEQYGKKFTSGVLAYNGILTSGTDDFDVTKISGDSFEIKFKAPHDEPPVVLAMASWTRVGYVKEDENDDENDDKKDDKKDDEKDDEKKTKIEMEGERRTSRDVNFGISRINRKSFRVDSTRYLGYSFLVIGQNNDLPTKNIKYGFVTSCTKFANSTTVGQEQFIKGATVAGDWVRDCNPSIPSEGDLSDLIQNVTTTETPKHAGVKILFNQPFKDIPSVIATPYSGRKLSDKINGANFAPRCVVESITKKFARIKCGIFSKTSKSLDSVVQYEPIPFTFLAVGNAIESVKDIVE